MPGRHRVVEVEAALRHLLADRPVEEAGVEIGQAIVASQTLGEGALARRRRPVDGDDHASPIEAPRLSIKGRNSGKLVAIGLPSSTVTGFWLARPSTRKHMAMR